MEIYSKHPKIFSYVFVSKNNLHVLFSMETSTLNNLFLLTTEFVLK